MGLEWLKVAGGGGAHTVGARRLPPRTVELGAAKAQSPEAAAQIPMRGGLPARQSSVGQTARSLERYSPLVPPGNSGVNLPPAFVDREPTLSGLGPRSVRIQLDQWGRPQVVPAETLFPRRQEPFYVSGFEEPTMTDMRVPKLGGMLKRAYAQGSSAALAKFAIAGVRISGRDPHALMRNTGPATSAQLGGMKMRPMSSLSDYARAGMTENQAFEGFKTKHPVISSVFQHDTVPFSGGGQYGDAAYEHQRLSPTVPRSRLSAPPTAPLSAPAPGSVAASMGHAPTLPAPSGAAAEPTVTRPVSIGEMAAAAQAEPTLGARPGRITAGLGAREGTRLVPGF